MGASGSVRHGVRVDGAGWPGHAHLAEFLGLFAEEVEGGEEAFGGGGVEGAAAGLDGVAFAAGMDLAEGFAVGEDAGEGVDAGDDAGQGGGVDLLGGGVFEGPVAARERVERGAGAHAGVGG